MVDALQAAAAVETLLSAPEHSHVALRFLRDRRCEAAARDRAHGAPYYAEQARGCPTGFWSRHECLCDTDAPNPPIVDRAAPAPSRRQRLRLSPRATWQETGVIEHGRIVPKRALIHPALERPLTYLAGCPAPDLLGGVADTGASVGQIAERWTVVCGALAAHDLLDWMWRREILVNSEAPQPVPERSAAGVRSDGRVLRSSDLREM